MTESPRSERYMDLTRFSTPVPELDDHRHQMQTPPRIEAPMERSLSPHDTSQMNPAMEPPERPDLLNVQDALRDGPVFRDFENALVDDDRSLNEIGMGRRFSVDPAAQYHTLAISALRSMISPMPPAPRPYRLGRHLPPIQSRLLPTRVVVNAQTLWTAMRLPIWKPFCNAPSLVVRTTGAQLSAMPVPSGPS